MMRAPLRFKNRSNTFDLKAVSIDGASEWLVENLTEAGVRKDDRVRARLLFEEALLNFATRFGSDQVVIAFLERRYGRLRLRVAVEGARFNPLSSRDEDLQDEWSASLFAAIGMRTHYSYAAGTNVLRLSLPQPTMNPVLKMAIAIAMGTLVGVLGSALTPEAVHEAINYAVLQPIADMWVRFLQAISGPVIFLTALTAALGTKSISDFGASRFSVIVRYFIISMLAVVFAMLVSLPFFPLDIGATQADERLVAEVLKGILNIIPQNLVEPFGAANTPQLLLIAIATGYLLAAVDSPMTELTTLIQQLNVLGLAVAQWACSFVPIFVGLLLCLKIWVNDVGVLWPIALPLVLAAAISIVVFSVAIVVVSLRLRLNPFLLVRKLQGPFMAALARGTKNYSSVEELALSCKRMLGVSGTFARATLPQGLVLFMPVSAVGICVFSLFAAQTQQIAVDQMWILSAAALSIVLAVATPPLTGANLLSFIVAFSYLGIPNSVILDVMIFDILFDELCVAFDQAMLQLDTIWQAKSIGFLDEDVLRAPVAA